MMVRNKELICNALPLGGQNAIGVVQNASEALTRDTRHLTQAQGTHTLCSGMLSTWWVVCASHATAFGPTTTATIGSAYVGRAMMTLLQPTICVA